MVFGIAEFVVRFGVCDRRFVLFGCNRAGFGFYVLVTEFTCSRFLNLFKLVARFVKGARFGCEIFFGLLDSVFENGRIVACYGELARQIV